jgi:hypothetical protein
MAIILLNAINKAVYTQQLYPKYALTKQKNKLANTAGGYRLKDIHVVIKDTNETMIAFII